MESKSAYQMKLSFTGRSEAYYGCVLTEMCHPSTDYRIVWQNKQWISMSMKLNATVDKKLSSYQAFKWNFAKFYYKKYQTRTGILLLAKDIREEKNERSTWFQNFYNFNTVRLIPLLKFNIWNVRLSNFPILLSSCRISNVNLFVATCKGSELVIIQFKHESVWSTGINYNTNTRTNTSLCCMARNGDLQFTNVHANIVRHLLFVSFPLSLSRCVGMC